MKNNRGFTLIEVIMVIAILSILSIILVPNIIGLMNQNKTDTYCALLDTIKSAATLCTTDNRYSLEKINASYPSQLSSCTSGTTSINISLNYLMTNDYLVSNDSSGKLINPIDKTEIDTSSTSNNYVKVIYDCSDKKFTKYEVVGDIITNYSSVICS